MSKQYTKAEVAQHKGENGMFIIVDDGVYDVAGMFSPSPCVYSGRRRRTPDVCLETDSATQARRGRDAERKQRLTDANRRLRRRPPGRRKDPQARGRQGRHQAVLEVPRQERAREVRPQAQGRHAQGGGQALSGLDSCGGLIELLDGRRRRGMALIPPIHTAVLIL